MLERLALWLAERTGRSIAIVAIVCGGLCAYGGVWPAALSILSAAAFGLGLAWDQDSG